MLGWLPDAYGGASSYAGDIDAVFQFIYWLTFAIFWLVTILMVWFLYRYRYREGETRRATYTHGNMALELIWTIIPAIVFVGIWFVSKTTWADIKGQSPPPDVEVRLTAKQFAWIFAYPGPDRQFDTTDDKTDKELNVPLNKVVRVHLRSDDVIHSFFVPWFRIKQDAVQGVKFRCGSKPRSPDAMSFPAPNLRSRTFRHGRVGQCLLGRRVSEVEQKLWQPS